MTDARHIEMWRGLSTRDRVVLLVAYTGIGVMVFVATTVLLDAPVTFGCALSLVVVGVTVWVTPGRLIRTDADSSS